MSEAEVTTERGFDLKRFLADQLRNIAPVFTLVALVVFFSIASSSFLTLDNTLNIIRQSSITGIIAVGLTFVILTAEIDLSVAAIANAVGITVAYFTIQPDYVNIANMPVQGWIAIILAVAAAFAFGLVTAGGITIIGIPSFIMTLAMMQIANGVSAMLVRGQIAYQYPDLITTLGSGTAFKIPLGIDAAGKAAFIPIGWTIIVCLIFLIVGHLVLTYTRYGRYIYMVGGNREAAEYSGVNVKFIVGSVMVICAVCSGVAGMLGVAYFGSAQQNQFDTFLLDAIAASTTTLEDAGEQTLAFLREHVPEARTVPLCGNSIGTDRRFLAKHLNDIEEHLHYRSVDVSTIKELARRWYPEVLSALPRKATAHRALDDIRESIEELRFYRSRVFVPPPGTGAPGPVQG